MKKVFLAILFIAVVLSAACTTKVPKAEIKTAEDLIGKTVGVQLGTTGDIYVSDLGGGTVVEKYNKGFEAVQALKQGKVDAVVIDDQPALVFVSQNDDIKILDELFATEHYAMCVSKDNKELTEAINKAIAELKEDGTLQAIVDYYIGGAEGSEPYASPEGTVYDGTLIMATNAEFPPYEYRDGEKIIGLDVDFSRAICDKLGKELVVEDMDFGSIIAAVQSGKADFGAAGMTVTEDRMKSIDFTDSYYTGLQVIIIKK